MANFPTVRGGRGSYPELRGDPNSMSSAVATVLNPAPRPVGAPITNIGAVASLPNYQGMLPPLDSFSVELDNASSANVLYIIGDPTGGIADTIGGTISDPTGASWSVLGMKQSFGFAPVAIRGFNYQTSSSAAQFFQPFDAVSSDIKGNILKNGVPISQAQRNTQFNDLFLTIELVRPMILNWQNAILVSVLAGETVNLEFYPYMASNRV